MKVRLVTKTEGVEGTEYYNRSLDDIITAKARVSSSREINELFEDGSKLLRHCILNQHWCFDKETEILTSDGFKNIQSVSKLDQVACYNKDNDSVYFDFPLQMNKQKYTGEMIGFNNRYVDFLVTPNHRIPFINKKGKVEVKEASLIFNNNKRSSALICYAKETLNSIQVNPFINYDKRIMSLVGFFIGDGCVKTSDHGVVFHLKVERKIEYLKGLCKELNLTLKVQGSNHYVVKSLELKNIFISLFQNNNGEKTIPKSFAVLETELKDLLLEGLIESDGHENKGSLIYDTTSADLVEALQTIFCINGYKIIITKRKRESLNHKERYRLYFSKRQHTQESKDVQGGWYAKDYNDYVYCLSVPTEFLVIRRNNKVSISGNSVFDQAFLGFEVVTSKDMGREILRHYSMNFQELSRRYSSDNLEIEPIELRMQSKSNRQSSTELFDPVISIATNSDTVQNTLASVLISNNINGTIELYNSLIDGGVARECARGILPGATTTVMEIEGSLRSWITFLNARLHKTAQKEVRLVAEHIRDVFIKQCPSISKALYNFEDSYDIHVLERIVLEKYGFYNMAKHNDYKKIK